MGSPITSLACLLIIIMSIHGSPDSTLNDHWKLWTLKHQKVYMNAMEEVKRRMIWEDNLKFVTIHNLEYSLGLHTFEVGMNHLADMTAEEVTATMTGFRAPEIQKTNCTDGLVKWDVKAPESIDWRTKGCVTDVKNQGGCHSCWAFSATGAVECQVKLKTGKLQSLSAQELVDCNKAKHGCKGGRLEVAFSYIVEKGIALESSYPYVGKEGTCFTAPKAAKCVGCETLPTVNELELQQVVGTVGPVSVAIDSSLTSFRLYKSGVYYDCNCRSNITDHAVLAVGYGTENGADYWLLKNSWGTGFGEQGYIKMARNRCNHCGITNNCVYPISCE
ncbi:cathepsin K-like [Lithobates pipiens]